MKVIETAFRGYRFRSRLEARWAVCLDHLRWDWEYEPEGFVLPSGSYLPDFLIRGGEGDYKTKPQLWLEIKPVPPTDAEKLRMKELVQATGIAGAFGVGLPNPDVLAYGLPGYDVSDDDGEYLPSLASIHDYARSKWNRPGWVLYGSPSSDDFLACVAARSARFERERTCK